MSAYATATTKDRILNINVVVAALGYFVDIYDLLLFGIVRVASLRDIGVPADRLLDEGVFLINAQMAGMLLGGVLWGVLGDKRGRLSVLFGSIFLYSIANILNAFVTDVTTYGVLRFLAGVGLAGELGAAITLVSETMSKETRGYGTTIVASVGILGAVVAALIGDFFHWKTAYLIGGGMGLALLILRISMMESGLFNEVRQREVKRGDFFMLFYPRERFFKYLRCILIGVPIWFVVGILVTFSPELAQSLGVQGTISAGSAIMWCYIGLSAGDLASGWLSQVFRTRKLVVFSFLSLTGILVLVYLFLPGLLASLSGDAATANNLSLYDAHPAIPGPAAHGMSSAFFYAICTGLGFASGYWAVFVTIAAEQFGTNLRATVTTSVPNFVRGSVVPLTLAFQFLRPSLGLQYSALVVGFFCVIIALLALWFLQETYAKDLDYLEE